MDPFFSVIIASLNNVEALTNCINSINKQTFNSYEVIVSDGGSNDGSILLLQPNIIRNLKWHKSCKDNGIYDALNIGISKANGQWLLVLGSDDLLSDENALLRAYNIILLDVTTPHFYYSDIFIKNKKKIKIKKYSPINIFNREYAGGPFFHHQSVFFKRSSIIELGYFDITYKIHADYFLLLKAHLIIPAKKINSSFVNPLTSAPNSPHTSYNFIEQLTTRIT
jgi:glycosyltransferase involved in cell wall biosynthesis